MPLIRRRTSAGLAQGLNEGVRGFALGAEIGMRKRRIVNEEEEAVRRAMLEDREMRREEQLRVAQSDAVGEMAQLTSEEQIPSATNVDTGEGVEGPPTAETSQAQDEDSAAMDRIETIARIMASKGDMKGALALIDRAHDMHIQAKDHRERDNLVRSIQQFMEGSDSYATAPDSSLVEDPAFAKTLTELSAKAADKDIPVGELRADFTKARTAQIDARTRQGHKRSMTETYRQRKADAMAGIPPDSPGFAQMDSALEGLNQKYELEHGDIFGDKSGRRQEEHDKAFNLAAKGKVSIHDEDGKEHEVLIPEARKMMAIFQERAQLKSQLQQAQIEAQKARAERDRAEADRAARDTSGGRGGAAGSARADSGEEKGLSFKDAYTIVEKRHEKDGEKPKNDALVREARELVRQSRAEGPRELTARESSEFIPSGYAAQTPQPASEKMGAFLPEAGTTPAERRTWAEKNAANLKGKFPTKEALQMWISTGKGP